MVTESFEELPMPRKEMAQLSVGSYRVYKNAKEFVTVQAGSAIEALQTSGVKPAHKIERDSFDHTKILGASDWGSPKQEEQPSDTPVEPQETSPDAEKETVLVEESGGAETKDAPEGGDETLSGDDVDKLLNN